MNEYRKLAGQIILGEQEQVKEIIESYIDDNIDCMTIKELVGFIKENIEHLNKFIV